MSIVAALRGACPVASERSERSCKHCGQGVHASRADDFCCGGCAAVFDLLRDERLGRYYELRGPLGRPVVGASRRPDDKWLVLLASELAAAKTAKSIAIDIQGMHCSACVWLIEELFRREPAGGTIEVNPTLGRLTLLVRPDFELRRFLERIEAVGYPVGPASKEDSSASRALIARFGVSAALTMNVMIFSVSIYAGLAPGQLRSLLERIDCALASVVVLVGGGVFFGCGSISAA